MIRTGSYRGQLQKSSEPGPAAAWAAHADALQVSERGQHRIETEAYDDEAQRSGQYPAPSVHPVLMGKRPRLERQQQSEHDRQEQRVHHLDVDDEVDEVKAEEHDDRTDDMSEPVDDVEPCGLATRQLI